jgi:hypothetical protein
MPLTHPATVARNRMVPHENRRDLTQDRKTMHCNRYTDARLMLAYTTRV